MDIKSLMIGDWVYNKNIDKPMQVYPTMFSQMSRSNSNATTEGYNIFPIPITPEILEKNGFIRDMFYGEWQFDLDPFPFSVVQRENNSWYLGREEHGIVHNREIIDISYVHELQHALRLCGTSKEIEL